MTARVAASVMKPAPVTPRAPFEVSIATARRVSSWPSVRSAFGRLGQEQRGQRHVDVGAVEVEAVAGRDHEADRPTCEAPSRSIFAIICGSAVSDDEVPSTISSSSLM